MLSFPVGRVLKSGPQGESGLQVVETVCVLGAWLEQRPLDILSPLSAYPPAPHSSLSQSESPFPPAKALGALFQQSLASRFC